MAGRRSFKVVLLLIVLSVLAACNTATPPPNLTPLALPPTAASPSAPAESATPTATDTPTATFTPSHTPTATATWTPFIVVGTYTPSLTYTISPTFTPSQTFTPSMTYTPSETFTPTATFTATDTLPPPTFTPTEDQPGPAILAVAPASSALQTAEDPRCAPATTQVTAQVQAVVGLYTIELNVALNGANGQVVPMSNIGGDLYAATLGPFMQPGVVAFWVTAADNWGKWTTSEPQQVTVNDCDVVALDQTEAAATAAPMTATAIATYGGPTSTPGGSLLASDVNITTEMNTPVQLGLSAQGGFPPYTFTVNTQPLNGTLSGDPPILIYTPNAGYQGNDSFTFLAQDSAGQQDVGVVNITVTAGGLTAQNQNLTVAYESSGNAITLDVSGGVPPYAVTITDQPDNGTLLADGTDPLAYTYDPDAGFVGLDTFSYLVTDDAGTEATATVSIAVAPPDPTGLIVFASNRDGDYDLYTINPDGTGLTQVFDTPDNEVEPSWSPDGSQIVFASDADGDYDLYTINSDGTGLTGPLTANTANDREPAWSPNDTWIAYASDEAGEWDVMRLATADLSTVNIGTAGEVDRNPAWSPDSAQIAYQLGTGAATDIYRMNNDGSGKTQLTTQLGRDIDPAWSPDGTRIAFASNRSGNFELYTMNTNGNGQTQVTDRAAHDRAPVWSPDGYQLALYNDAAGNNDIRLRWANNLGGSRLTNNAADDIDPAWRP